MRCLIVTDIHANAVALEAVLATPEARSCERVISLGDQINYGPQPREVMRRLRELNAVMLLGNHEERFGHLNDPAFRGYNWRPLHWTHAQLGALNPSDFPLEWRLGPVLMTHAVPGNPYRLIFKPEVPEVLRALPEDVTMLITGHNHLSWQVEAGNRLACNPGSLGLLEDAPGGLAPFLVLAEECGQITVSRHLAPYDVDAVERAYIESGMAKAAPEMSRECLEIMRYGRDKPQLIRFIIDHAPSLGLTVGDQEAWQRLDSAWSWHEPIPTHVFWKQKEQALHVCF